MPTRTLRSATRWSRKALLHSLVSQVPQNLVLQAIATGSPGSSSRLSRRFLHITGIPFGAAMVTRGFFIVIRAQTFFERKFLPAIAPLSLIALLFTTLIIFAAQGHQVVQSITDVLRVAAPLLVYFLVMFFGVLFICRHFGVGYPRTATQAFTAASNNFELSISVAIATWGADSPQALASTVGPLVEYVSAALGSGLQVRSH